MLNLKRVLVVVDPDQEEQTALEKVLTLEKVADFDITLLSCGYTQYLVEGYYFDAIDLPTLRQEFLDERKATLESLAAPLRENGLSVDTLSVWAHPAYEATVREAVRLEADLVVQHTRQHSALSRLLLTHNDWQLVRCCPMPLLLVKESPWQDRPVLLAAVDPKHARHKPAGLDHKILDITMDLANVLKGDVFVTHSYSQIPLSGKQLKEAREEHQRAFEDLLSGYDIPQDRQHLTEEAPEFALSELERELQADIVIMGAISRSIVSDVFIGSTTEKVLDFLECDVLIVKPEGYKTPVVLKN
jgi:universal stress protein E